MNVSHANCPHLNTSFAHRVHLRPRWILNKRNHRIKRSSFVVQKKYMNQLAMPLHALNLIIMITDMHIYMFDLYVKCVMISWKSMYFWQAFIDVDCKIAVCTVHHKLLFPIFQETHWMFNALMAQVPKPHVTIADIYCSGLGVTKPILSVPLFSKFVALVKTNFSCWISRLYLKSVAAA